MENEGSAKREAQVARALKELKDEIGGLEKRADIHYQKLSAVLRPTKAEVEAKGIDAREPSSLCALAAEIEKLTQSIQRISNDLGIVTERVEL